MDGANSHALMQFSTPMPAPADVLRQIEEAAARGAEGREAWLRAAETLAHLSTAIAWAWCDWYLIGERHGYGELTALCRDPNWRGPGLGRFQNILSVARAFGGYQSSRRREHLSFKHHTIIAPLPEAEQEAALDWCEATRASTKALKKHLDELHPPAKPDVPEVIVPEPEPEPEPDPPVSETEPPSEDDPEPPKDDEDESEEEEQVTDTTPAGRLHAAVERIKQVWSREFVTELAELVELKREIPTAEQAEAFHVLSSIFQYAGSFAEDFRSRRTNAT